MKTEFPDFIPSILYSYYSPLTVDVGYQKDKGDYEIEMIAQKPDMQIDVEVVDSMGNLLSDFPVKNITKSGPKLY